MQARIEAVRFPFAVVVALVAISLALVLGMALGYAIKPAARISVPYPVFAAPAAMIPADEANPPCVFVNKHKEC